MKTLHARTTWHLRQLPLSPPGRYRYVSNVSDSQTETAIGDNNEPLNAGSIQGSNDRHNSQQTDNENENEERQLRRERYQQLQQQLDPRLQELAELRIPPGLRREYIRRIQRTLEQQQFQLRQLAEAWNTSEKWREYGHHEKGGKEGEEQQEQAPQTRRQRLEYQMQQEQPKLLKLRSLFLRQLRQVEKGQRRQLERELGKFEGRQGESRKYHEHGHEHKHKHEQEQEQEGREQEKGQRQHQDQHDKLQQESQRDQFLLAWNPPTTSLPRSPIVDQHEKRAYEHATGQKWYKRRKPTFEDLRPLRQNPWAMAIATNPRTCMVTGTRLPRALLTDWGLLRLPDSNRLWMMPYDMLKEYLREEKEKRKGNDMELDEDGSDGDGDGSAYNLSAPQIPTFRIVDRLLVIKEITKQLVRSNSVKKPLAGRLIPNRWKTALNGPLSPEDEGLLTWREDMPDLLLRRWRDMVLKSLEEACLFCVPSNATRKVWSIVPLDGGDCYSEAALVEALGRLEAIEGMARGVVLVVGPRAKINRSRYYKDTGGKEPKLKREAEISPEELSSVPTEERGVDALISSTLPDFVTLPQTRSKVPVFDLSALLSDADLDALGMCHWRFTETALFLRPDEPYTVDAVLALWRLKGSAMSDAQFLSKQST